LERGSPKVKVWTGLMQNKFIGPFFFSEKLWPAVRTWTCWGSMYCPNYTSTHTPTRWGTATLLPQCKESPGQRDDWEMDLQRWTNFQVARFNLIGFFLVELSEEHYVPG
jgi:hypothetical protein